MRLQRQFFLIIVVFELINFSVEVLEVEVRAYISLFLVGVQLRVYKFRNSVVNSWRPLRIMVAVFNFNKAFSP